MAHCDPRCFLPGCRHHLHLER